MRVGISNTIPAEVVIAAGHTLIDLNNIFVTSDDYSALINNAEVRGFPRSLCAFIKGVYGASKIADIDEFVGVLEGDCSSTSGLIDVLDLDGVQIAPFAYPHSRKYEDLKEEIDKFINYYNTNWDDVNKTKKRLDEIRKLGLEIDRLTYEENKVSGFENHLLMVSFSDFCSDPNMFENTLLEKIEQVKDRVPFNEKVRIAYIGVPPMTGDIYEFLEERDARVVYNEIQREFSMPRFVGKFDLVEVYRDYTYPYDIDHRIKEINNQIEHRNIDAVIHYNQAFCHKAMDNMTFKEKINVPILSIEGDKLNELDGRTKLRIEAFIDMLIDKKEAVSWEF
jgi:benzoyl-CoA reductase/2-hydroxyglutaryl-CoA dehydratase subunit BcrC/BadD/HgdB